MKEERLIYQLIDKAKVVSFDIFDTIILRLVSQPEDIFRIMEKRLNIDNFKEYRVKMQIKISKILQNKYGYPHATLNEIYQYINENNIKNIDSYLVKKYEVELEFSAAVKNEEVFLYYEYARRQGKKVIATSDMYLEGSIITELLRKCGYLHWDAIYVSSDTRKAKFNGDMYQHIVQREGCEPKEFLHIGDNYRSDYCNAIKSGWNAYYYNKVKLENKYDIEFESIHQATLNYVNKKYIMDDNKFWINLGARIGGPIYYNLVQWITHNITYNNYDNIYFLSRDGYNLYTILNQRGVKNIKYVYMSRRSLILAGIDEIDDISLSLLPPYAYGQTVGEILRFLNLTNIDINTIKQCGFKNKDAIIHNKQDIKKFKDLYKYNEKVFLEVCKKERRYAEKYFEKENILTSKALFFDCGWNGSTQYLLDRVLERLKYSGKNNFNYFGIFSNNKSKFQLDGKKYECYLFSNEDNSKIQKRISKAVVIAELFFGAPHNSLLRYGDNEFIFEDLEKNLNYREKILLGIQEYIQVNMDFLLNYKINNNNNNSVNELIRLIEKPTKEEANNIGGLENIDSFTSVEHKVSYITKISLRESITFKRELYWLKGMLKTEYISFLTKIFLISLNCIKKAKYMLENRIKKG